MNVGIWTPLCCWDCRWRECIEIVKLSMEHVQVGIRFTVVSYVQPARTGGACTVFEGIERETKRADIYIYSGVYMSKNVLIEGIERVGKTSLLIIRRKKSERDIIT